MPARKGRRRRDEHLVCSWLELVRDKDMQPLEGVKVLDCTKVLAGPLCTQYLSDLGADIIKVEPTVVGDETRRWPPIRGDFGSVFLSVNRNKKSVALDLKNPEGRLVIRDLIRNADVLIE